MYKIGDKLKVPVLLVQEGNEVNKGYAFGVVLGESKTVPEATEFKVDLGGGKHTIANIKNSDIEILNKDEKIA